MAEQEHCNTETEEGTIAFDKKRSRRVSFAENTSVHFFDRDDEYETPPDATKPSSSVELRHSGEGLRSVEGNESKEKEYLQSEEEEEEEDEDEDDMDELGSRSPFLRLVGSSSPGSTIGSATSNDEDNFFGPVSASFIRPRLSDSVASDENHDLTMDSTAFSMHFRSIARSESEGDLKTSTGVHLSFEEKTPTRDSTPTNIGSSMALTVAKKPNSQSSVPISKLSSGFDSNDMSLVGEYIHRYDYDKLPPSLDALLVEGSKDLHVISLSSFSSVSKSPRNMGKKLSPSKENGGDLMDLSYDRDKEIVENITHGMLTEVVMIEHNELGEANGGSKIYPSCQPAFSFPADTSDAQASNALSPNHLIRGTPSGKGKEAVKDAFEVGSGLDFSAVSCGSPSNLKNMFHQLNEVRGQEHKSPLAGSTSSLSAKRKRVHLDSTSPSKSPWTMTPSRKGTSFLVRTENKAHGDSASSLQKSISKLAMLEASPFSAALNAKIHDSNLKSLVNLSRMTPFDTVLEKNSKVPKINHVDDNWIETHHRDAYSEEQLSTSAQKKRKEASSLNMDDSRIDTPKNTVAVTRTEKSVKLASPLALPSEFTWSGEKTQPYLLTSANATEAALAISRNDSTVADIRLGYDNNRKEIGSPRRLKLVKSPEYQGSLLRGQRQHFQYNKLVNFGPGHPAGSRENVDATISTAAADKLDSLLIERREKSLNIGISTEVEMMDNREVALRDVRDKSETVGNFATSLTDKEPGLFQSKITDRDVPLGGVKSVSCESADKPSSQKNLIDQFCQSPVREELSNVSHDDNIHSVPVEEVSPKFSQLINGALISAERKRRNQDLMIGKVDRIQRSPKLLKIGVSEPEFSECLGSSMISRNGHNLKHLAEISTKISENTKRMLSTSADKLNFQAIDILEDILGQLQRSKTYQILCTEIQSQKNLDPASNIAHKRVAGTRLLLCQIVHEQAKLQLMNMKRERLLKRVHLLNSGIKESEVLKLNCLPLQSVVVQVDDCHPQSFSSNVKDIEKCQVNCDKVTAMGHTLEDLEKRILNLTKSFHTSCKIKGEPSSADTIAFVNDHLMKRACCQIIRKDLQLWVVDNLESKNGHQNVVLNYLDLIIQWLTITVGPVPSISISNKLNNINIINNFKDMDACTAFGFVFNAETTKKYVGARSLALETQMSSSLLGNLLDVVEEIQLAWAELRNLTHTSFCSSFVEHLDLQLSFVDFKRGRKAMLTLDMSCLKRGVYPSEILPYQIDVSVNGPQNDSAHSLSAEITAAVQNLRVGSLRIIRLCRCISQLFNASNV